MCDGGMKQEEVWDKIARPWKGFRHYEVSHVTDFLESKKGKVLDLGCGSGRNFMESEDLDFYGVDFSSKMVELAEKRGIAVEVKKGDVSGIPYEDEVFDWVIFSAALHCVESKEKRQEALGECFRVLKEGGEMMVSVWGRGSGRVKNREKESYVPWTVGDVKVERYTYLYEMSELRDELVEAGFEIVSCEEKENIVFVVRKN